MKKSEVDFKLRMMGFGNSCGRDFLSAACLLYAGGMHKMQDIVAKISDTTGMDRRKIYGRMLSALEAAWRNQERSPRVMYNTRIRPSLKKFIRMFVEQRMEENNEIQK